MLLEASSRHYQPSLLKDHQLSPWKRPWALESQAWARVGEQSEESLLVKPSGQFSSKLAHYLHQPSNNTGHAANGETADMTNGCTAMIMGNAFEQGKTLMFDHLHRRSKKSSGLEEYPENALECHEDWTRQILEASQAKVIVVYGKKVQDRIMENPKRKLTTLPLWGEFDGQFIVLDHEKNYRNADKHFIPRRILIFAAHPQHLFYKPRQDKILQKQDIITVMATRMAAAGVPYEGDYYANKKWMAFVRGCCFQNIAKRSLSFDPAELSESEVEESKASLFDEFLHSTETLRSLTRDVLDCWSKYRGSERCRSIRWRG